MSWDADRGGHEARGEVPVAERGELGGRIGPLFLGVRTAPAEAAAGLGINDPWRLADVLVGEAELHIGIGNGREQELGVGMPGLAQDAIGGTLLDEPSGAYIMATMSARYQALAMSCVT
jgi:hypothetical protein